MRPVGGQVKRRSRGLCLGGILSLVWKERSIAEDRQDHLVRPFVVQVENGKAFVDNSIVLECIHQLVAAGHFGFQGGDIRGELAFFRKQIAIVAENR